jgi:hypothetical protein
VSAAQVERVARNVEELVRVAGRYSKADLKELMPSDARVLPHAYQHLHRNRRLIVTARAVIYGRNA